MDAGLGLERGTLGGVSEPASLMLLLRPFTLGEDAGVVQLSSSVEEGREEGTCCSLSGGRGGGVLLRHISGSNSCLRDVLFSSWTDAVFVTGDIWLSLSRSAGSTAASFAGFSPCSASFLSDWCNSS